MEKYTFYADYFGKKCNFAAEMTQVQFTALVLMILLALKLQLLPVKTVDKVSLGKTRWLMTACMALLAVQFMIQYALQLRNTGHVAQAIMLNLAVFIPCTNLLSLAILYLLNESRVNNIDRFIGLPTWMAAMTLLFIGLKSDGEPLMAQSPILVWAEIGASALYAGMQAYYFERHIRELRRLRQALQDYYDRDTDGLLSWMEVSIVLLALFALMVPLIIFTNGRWLVIFSLGIFGGIFYLIDSFCLYVVSSASRKVAEVKESEEETERDEETEAGDDEAATRQTEENLRHVEQAVKQWTAAGGYRENGITMPAAAAAIGVPRYHLTLWLKQHDIKYTQWINDLRIADAKRLLEEKSGWSNEAIADYCGFSDRSYFQKKFKESTGMTPTDYLTSISKK